MGEHEEEMTPKMNITNDRTRLRLGQMVMVCYPIGERWHNPAHKLDGLKFVIKTKHQPYSTWKPQYTLFEANSDAGKPYWFLEDELIPM